MANKKREAEKKQIEIARLKQKKRNRILAGITSAAVVFVIVFSIMHLTGSYGSHFTQPNNLTWGSFTQISDKNFGNITNIYYVSWLGCPIGAADSWAFYASLSKIKNISIYVTPHYSDPNDSSPNTPGLIFNDFQLPMIDFHSYYVYNEFLNATTSGLLFNTTSALSVGMSELSGLLPTNIYDIEKSAMENIPTHGAPGGSYPTGLFLKHVNTNIIITGQKGAWILNGPLYSPTILAGLNSTLLLDSLYTNNTAIIDGADQITAVITNTK